MAKICTKKVQNFAQCSLKDSNLVTLCVATTKLDESLNLYSEAKLSWLNAILNQKFRLKLTNVKGLRI